MATDDIILRTAVSPFPPGYCPSSQQQFADDIATALEVFFPGEFALTIKSPNQPTVEQRGYTWNKTDASTGMSVGYFEWNVVIGAWARPHWPNGTPTNERRIYIGSLLSLETFDGGQSGTVSQSTGPFWERDTAFSDHWPIGVGALVASPLSVAVSIFDDAVPGVPNPIGVYFIKPTARIWDVAT